MKNKNGIAQIIVLISLLAGLLTIGVYSGVLDVASITGSGSYVERPVFYYDKCEQSSDLKIAGDFGFGDHWLYKPSVTDAYSITFKADDSFESRLIYSICNSEVESSSNCRVYKKEIRFRDDYETHETTDLKNTEIVHGLYQTRKLVWKTGWATYTVSYQPYKLARYNVLGGSPIPVSANSCQYQSGYSTSDTIINSNGEKINNYKPEDRRTDERTLKPNEVRWYLAGHLTSAEPSFALKYDGKNAWCRQTGNSGEIYKINTVQTSGGTYKIASSDWSDKLGDVNCCPTSISGSKVCNDDFEYIEIENAECGAFKSCGSPNWVAHNTGEIVKYSCIDGTCQKEVKEVECASDFDCKDTNEICDLRNFECLQANVDLQGQVIETIPDNRDDCNDKGGKWITQTTEDKSFLNFVGFGKPDIIVTEYCQINSGINYVFWIIIIIIIIMVFLFRGQLRGLWNVTIGRTGLRI